MITGFTPKQPFEEYAVSFDFTLVVGTAAIVSADIYAFDYVTNEDVSIDLLNPVKFLVNSPLVYGWVQGGEAGRNYIITCRAICNDDSHYELSAILPVNSTETVFVGVPLDSDACRIYEYCYDQAGAAPLTTITAFATIKNKAYDYDGKVHSIDPVEGTYDSVTGFVYWDIVRGSIVLFEITEIGLQATVTIPNQASIRLTTLASQQ